MLSRSCYRRGIQISTIHRMGKMQVSTIHGRGRRPRRPESDRFSLPHRREKAIFVCFTGRRGTDPKAIVFCSLTAVKKRYLFISGSSGRRPLPLGVCFHHARRGAPWCSRLFFREEQAPPLPAHFKSFAFRRGEVCSPADDQWSPLQFLKVSASTVLQIIIYPFVRETQVRIFPLP